MRPVNLQGPDLARFSPRFLHRLPPTLIGARIARRGALRGIGLGVVYPVCDLPNVGFAHNATTDARTRRCGVRCGLFVLRFKGLTPPTTPQRRKPDPLHVCVRMRVRVPVHMHAYAVVALCRCASLYLPEKKEEKKGLPTTPVFRAVVGSVVGLVNPLKSLEKRGF